MIKSSRPPFELGEATMKGRSWIVMLSSMLSGALLMAGAMPMASADNARENNAYCPCSTAMPIVLDKAGPM